MVNSLGRNCSLRTFPLAIVPPLAIPQETLYRNSRISVRSTQSELAHLWLLRQLILHRHTEISLGLGKQSWAWGKDSDHKKGTGGCVKLSITSQSPQLHPYTPSLWSPPAGISTVYGRRLFFYYSKILKTQKFPFPACTERTTTLNSH